MGSDGVRQTCRIVDAVQRRQHFWWDFLVQLDIAFKLANRGAHQHFLFALIKLNPDLFWPAILVATVGNTLGGAVSWLMGLGAHKALDRARGNATELRALRWLERFGPKACLLSWLPGVGDPLCAVAGWLKFPFWPCVAYMAIGKFARYVTMTAGLLWVFPGHLPA